MVKYKRVLLKLSGEALLGEKEYGVDMKVTGRVAQEIKEAWEAGTQMAVAVGGGNIFRGLAGATQGMDRATADYMGMLATCMNALALQDALEKIGVETRVMSAIEMQQIAELYIRRRAIRHMEKRRVIILAAGTGHPYFSTDMSAALRALELHADLMMKATKVDGVYDRHPDEKDAKMYEDLTFEEAIRKNLKILDSSALTLCRDNNLPILVFNVLKENQIQQAAGGKKIGTIINK